MNESNISIYEDVEYLITSFCEDLHLEKDDEKSNMSSANSNFSEITQIPAKTKVSSLKQPLAAVGNVQVPFLHNKAVTKTTKEDSRLMISILSTLADGTIQETFMCAVCKDTYIDREDLKEHLIVHKKYKCKTCRKLFYKQTYLHVHLKNSHRPSENLSCNICNAVFSKKYCLEQHMFLHADKKHFKCSFVDCGKRFQHVNSMLAHERIHYKDNRKKCPECGKLVTRLSSHLATHSIDLRHPCQECEKSYSTKYALQTHMRKKHANANIGLICEVCGTLFMGSEQLKYAKHVKTHKIEKSDQLVSSSVMIIMNGEQLVEQAVSECSEQNESEEDESAEID